MAELDVWTVSLMIRTDETRTRADAFLQGPAVEVECSASAHSQPRTAAIGPWGEDLAAARALEELSRRLIDRATHARARREHPAGRE
jgi:hypothetical protein